MYKRHLDMTCLGRTIRQVVVGDARIPRRNFGRRVAGAERLVDRLPGSFLIPHRKKGGRCPRCGGEIAGAKFSGRTAYYCPRCQPEVA